TGPPLGDSGSGRWSGRASPGTIPRTMRDGTHANAHVLRHRQGISLARVLDSLTFCITISVTGVTDSRARSRFHSRFRSPTSRTHARAHVFTHVSRWDRSGQPGEAVEHQRAGHGHV